MASCVCGFSVQSSMPTLTLSQHYLFSKQKRRRMNLCVFASSMNATAKSISWTLCQIAWLQWKWQPWILILGITSWIVHQSAVSSHFRRTNIYIQEVIIHLAASSPVKILSPAHPAKIRFPSEDFATCTPGQDWFEAYLAKFEASTCTKFIKNDRGTITVINKRLGRGQIPFRKKLRRPHI